MKTEAVIRWLSFQPRKLLLKIKYGKRFECGRKIKIDNSSEIHIDSHKASLSIADSISIKKNCELFSFGEGRLQIGKGVFINRNCIIGAHQLIKIGSDVTIGPNVCIYDHDHGKDGASFESSSIIIKEKAWIGANTCILRGVTIGENSIVAAGSIVTRDVPDNVILIQKREATFKKR